MDSKANAFGKLDIPKPHSGVSERRTSFFGNRTSFAGMARNSSYGGPGGCEKLKDPRPLHNKAYIQQCVKQLLEFLSEKGYPFNVTMKTLQSPSTKDFLKIFEFIYSFLDSSFQMPTSKVEEEVPRILRELGYPFPLSKSCMFSVGAPHTWPQVLVALIWLIDSVKIFQCLSGQDLLFSEFSDGSADIDESVESNKLFMDFTSETYHKFMQGADTFQREEHEYLDKLKRLYNVDAAALKELPERLQMLTEEVERLEKDAHTDVLMPQRTEKLKLQADMQKLQSYGANLVTYKGKLESQAAGLAEELEATGLQLDTLKQEKGKLQLVLDHQKVTPADVQRIHHDQKELQHTMKSLTESLEAIQRLMWNEELAMARAKESADLKMMEFNKLARKLKLIPASAANACGRDFEIKKTVDFGLLSVTRYKSQIEIPLRKMISDVEEECHRLSNSKSGLEESREQVSANVADKINDIKQLKEKIRKIDVQLEQDLEELALEDNKLAAELESAENHKKQLESKVNRGYDDAVEQQKLAVKR
ncbi:kinetochore protein NDC80 homolog [Aplochiton taeniatus]